MKTYELYEDNGGGLHLAILDGGKPVYMGHNYEAERDDGYARLHDDIDHLDDVNTWDPDGNDLINYPDAYEWLVEHNTPGSVELIADMDGVYPDRMGGAGECAWFGRDNIPEH